MRDLDSGESEQKNMCLLMCVCCLNCCLSCTDTHLNTDAEGKLTTHSMQQAGSTQQLSKLKKSIIDHQKSIPQSEQYVDTDNMDSEHEIQSWIRSSKMLSQEKLHFLYDVRQPIFPVQLDAYDLHMLPTQKEPNQGNDSITASSVEKKLFNNIQNEQSRGKSKGKANKKSWSDESSKSEGTEIHAFYDAEANRKEMLKHKKRRQKFARMQSVPIGKSKSPVNTTDEEIEMV